MENRDALNRYSAGLVGYNHSRTTAVAANAQYTQIAFEGFEDYYFNQHFYANYNFTDCSPPKHFGFPLPNLDEIGHSGKYSLKLPANSAVIEAEYEVSGPMGFYPAKPPFSPFLIEEPDCVGKFSPKPGKYVFSAWLKEDLPATALQYPDAFISVETGGQVYNFYADGDIIEGWQRVYGEFDISANASDIKISLHGGNVDAWFDDLRIHPFDASFKSYVYDDVNLRFTYELDENNYFTKYEYDQAGALERVKKETERGIMTIQESRFGQQKN